MAKTTIKKIEAIFNLERLPDVQRALDEIGISGFTLTPAAGIGRARPPHASVWRRMIRGNMADFADKVKIELLVEDSRANPAVEAIAFAARSGKLGDGKILVLPVEEVVRIRTLEKGEHAF